MVVREMLDLKAWGPGLDPQNPYKDARCGGAHMFSLCSCGHRWLPGA